MIQRLVEWFLSSPPASTFTAMGALIGAMALFRRQSRGEHKSTIAAIQDVSNQVRGNGNGDLHTRLDRIERTLGIKADDQAK